MKTKIIKTVEVKELGAINMESIEASEGQLTVHIHLDKASGELENLLCKMQQDFMKKHPEVEEMDINFDVRVAYSFGYLTWGGSDFNFDIFVWQDGHDDVVEEYDEIPLNLGEDGTREVKKVIWEALGKMLLNI
ncbi:hypothetical protein ACTNEQ_04185 [Blautia obeum]|uniref:hypothetical protein n=1 Tax=Blautia obeum TaxID=40520 RepID=UPI003F89FB9E